MAYATLQDLLTRFPAQDLAEVASDNTAITGVLLASHINPAVSVDDSDEVLAALSEAQGRLQAALDDASTTIDGHLASRYETPMDPAPAPLKGYCIDIAAYRLFEQRDPDPDANAPRRVRYDAAIKWLGRIAAGDISFRRDTSEPEGDNAIEYNDAPPTISEQTLAGF